MSEYYISPYRNPAPYIPGSLSEIYDLLALMVGGAPTFVDPYGVFPERNIDSVFYVLVEGFGKVRAKLGEERYAVLVDLAARAKMLFAGDPTEDNGKTKEGIALLYEIEDVIQSVRSRRVKARLKDQDGDISGD